MNEFLADENFNLSEPLETCTRMELCTQMDIFELLRDEQPLDLDVHIQTVNSNPRSNWKAGVNTKFEGASLKEIKSIMGTIVDPKWVIRLPEKEFEPTNIDLPESFDARSNWPKCESVIGHVRD